MLVLINWSKLILSRNCHMQKAGIHPFALLLVWFFLIFLLLCFQHSFLGNRPSWCFLGIMPVGWYKLKVGTFCSAQMTVFEVIWKTKWDSNQQKREGALLQFLVFRCFAVGLWRGFLLKDKLSWVCKELTPSYRNVKFKSRKQKVLHYDCFQTGKALGFSRAGLLCWACSVCSEALNY